MLNDLNEEQESLIDKLAQGWIDDAHCGDHHIDQRKAISCLKRIYALADLKEPEVVFLDGPMDAVRFCEEELKQKIDTFDWFGVGYDSGWVSFYDYFQRIGILERDDEEFNSVKEFMRSGVWATVLFENIAVCISRPIAVVVDENGNLHNDKGPAVEFADGYSEFCWHGTFVSENLIMRPREITREEIMAEKNSEVSRAMAERLGWAEYMKRAETVLIDKWFDPDKSLHYELYDFTKRFDLTPRLLKMESPELNDGGRPYYIEPVHPALKTCQAARKWQFQKDDGTWPEPEECNNDPMMTFEVEA